jgi:hypothetical protein
LIKDVLRACEESQSSTNSSWLFLESARDEAILQFSRISVGRWNQVAAKHLIQSRLGRTTLPEFIPFVRASRFLFLIDDAYRLEPADRLALISIMKTSAGGKPGGPMIISLETSDSLAIQRGVCRN